MRIVNENAPLEKHDIEELRGYIGTNKKVVCRIVRYNKNEGLVLDLGNGIEGYMHPFHFEDFNGSVVNSIIANMGQNIMAYVERIENNIVYLNRAKLQREYKREVIDKLELGTVMDTKVLSIAPFGVFVDLGYGVLGLLPISDISISRFSNIYKMFSKGDNIKVIYTGMGNSGYTVSHKELLGTWEENIADFKVGDYCQGIVREVMPYGIFIEIAPNLVGLSEVPEHFNLNLDDTVCVYIKNINSEKLKVKFNILSLSKIPYEVKYNYKIQDGVVKTWQYTPENSTKCIKRDFTISTK